MMGCVNKPLAISGGDIDVHWEAVAEHKHNNTAQAVQEHHKTLVILPGEKASLTIYNVLGWTTGITKEDTACLMVFCLIFFKKIIIPFYFQEKVS